jgi:hypothetical protein
MFGKRKDNQQPNIELTREFLEEYVAKHFGGLTARISQLEAHDPTTHFNSDKRGVIHLAKEIVVESHNMPMDWWELSQLSKEKAAIRKASDAAKDDAYKAVLAARGIRLVSGFGTCTMPKDRLKVGKTPESTTYWDGNDGLFWQEGGRYYCVPSDSKAVERIAWMEVSKEEYDAAWNEFEYFWVATGNTPIMFEFYAPTTVK